VEGTLANLSQIVARFAESATARACIGEAQHLDGRIVIPLAAVSLQTGFGFGFGSGGGGEGAQAGSGSGAGGGGGGRSSSRVIAIVDVSADGTKVHPVVDINGVLKSVLALAVAIALVTGGRRRGLRFLRRISSGSD
jgi:uncharacterized spore protein YtfJ